MTHRLEQRSWVVVAAAVLGLILAPQAAGAPVVLGAAEPPVIGTIFSLHHTSSERGTKITELAALRIPAGMKAVLRCSGGRPSQPRGCPLSRQARRFGEARAEHDFAPKLERRRLRFGTRVSIEVSAAGTTGKLLEIAVVRSGAAVTLSCVPPGQAAGPCPAAG